MTFLFRKSTLSCRLITYKVFRVGNDRDHRGRQSNFRRLIKALDCTEEDASKILPEE
jgi:hypothetical protein